MSIGFQWALHGNNPEDVEVSGVSPRKETGLWDQSPQGSIPEAVEVWAKRERRAWCRHGTPNCHPRCPICHPLKRPHRLIHPLARGEVAVGIRDWMVEGHEVPLRIRTCYLTGGRGEGEKSSPSIRMSVIWNPGAILERETQATHF